MVQTKFTCECCKEQFERFGSAGASCRKRLKQRGYVFCSKSCGGYKHGGFKNKTTEYSSWNAMKNRCNNPNHKSYARYGGRGITYDPTWNDFERFLNNSSTALCSCSFTINNKSHNISVLISIVS